MSAQSVGQLGIMVHEAVGNPPFAEAGFYRNLTVTGLTMGLAIYVFTTRSINWEQLTVRGYQYQAAVTGWRQAIFPLPAAIYDRCFYTDRALYDQHRQAVKRLQQEAGIPFISSQLKGKLEIAEALKTDPLIRTFIPDVVMYSDPSRLHRWLLQHHAAFLKPRDGMQGKGMLLVKQLPAGQLSIQGRTRRNTIIPLQYGQTERSLRAISSFIGRRPYLIQRYLELQTVDGRSYDIRSLVQKNGHGRWQYTGAAARIGSPNSITSNLAGGGHAAQAEQLLTLQFGSRQAAELLDRIEQLSITIAELLELRYGRLAELGIDYGVDRFARLWLLEVNAKPGRAVFTLIHDTNAKERAIRSLLEYARFFIRTRRSPLAAANE